MLEKNKNYKKKNLQPKDVVKILPTKFEESLMYQLCTAKEMQMMLFSNLYFNVQMLLFSLFRH